MKFDERRLPDLIRRIGAFRVVLVHGDDGALVAERARVLAQSVLAGSVGLIGPTLLDGADHGRIAEEVTSPVLGGGARLIRVRQATDAATSSVEPAFAAPQGVVVLIEAGALTARSRLRALVEANPLGASVSCWANEGRDLPAAIDRLVQGRGCRIEADARALLIDRADGYGAALDDAEKVTLLVGGSGMIRVADVLDIDPMENGAAVDALASAVAACSVADADRLLEAVLRDPTASSAVTRGLLVFFSRLRAVRSAVDGGVDLTRAMAALRPPVFFLRTAEFAAAVSQWSGKELDRACAILWRGEMACRATGAPVAAIVRRTVGEILDLGRSRARASGGMKRV